jgi:hypothetical protein
MWSGWAVDGAAIAADGTEPLSDPATAAEGSYGR